MPDDADTPMEPRRPFWMPDTRGFLAIAIISIMSTVVIVMLFRPVTLDERTAGVLMVILGVLTASLKDVYGYYFASSQGSDDKNVAIRNLARAVPAQPQEPGPSPERPAPPQSAPPVRAPSVAPT